MSHFRILPPKSKLATFFFFTIRILFYYRYKAYDELIIAVSIADSKATVVCRVVVVATVSEELKTESDTLLQSLGNNLEAYKPTTPRRQPSTSSQPPEPQLSDGNCRGLLYIVIFQEQQRLSSISLTGTVDSSHTSTTVLPWKKTDICPLSQVAPVFKM